MKKLIFLLLFPVLVFGQDNDFYRQEKQNKFQALFKDADKSFTSKIVYAVNYGFDYGGVVISESAQQGTIEEHPQGDFFGGKIDYAVYRSPLNSTHWLIFLPGTGELSDGAGGNIAALYKYGFPRLVKAGYDLPFNMVMIQPQNSYTGPNKIILPWVQMTFNPSKIIVSGISLGAIASLDVMTKDSYKLITGVVSLSGKPSGGSNAVANMVSVPGYCYHGKNDTQVSYSVAMNFFNAYNKAHAGTDNVFTMDIRDAGHSGWDEVMSVTPGKDQCYQWIISHFGNEPTGETFEDGKEYIKKSISEALDKL